MVMINSETLSSVPWFRCVADRALAALIREHSIVVRHVQSMAGGNRLVAVRYAFRGLTPTGAPRCALISAL
jgi:hypothetical protein